MKNLFKSKIFIFLFLSFVLYGPTIRNGFVMDDYSMLIEDQSIHDLGNLTENIFRSTTAQEPFKHIRPVSIVFRMILYKLFGAHAVFYHLVNILLFALYCFLYFRFSFLITGNEAVAFLAAVIVACHPINHVPVNFITGHEIIIFGILDLLAAIYFYHFLANRSRSSRSLSVLFYVLALLTQEVNVAVVVIIFSMAYWLKKKSFKSALVDCSWHLWAVFLFVGFKFLKAAPSINIFAQQNPVQGDSLLSFVYSLSRLYGWYISKLFVPADIVFMANSYATKEMAWLYLAVGMMFILFSIFFICRNRQETVLCFCLFWFIVGLVPVSFLCLLYYAGMGLIIEPHWLFFTSGGLFLFTAILLHRAFQKLSQKFMIGLIVIIFSAWLPWVNFYNRVWKSNFSYSFYWLKTIAHNPYALLSIAKEYERKDDPQKAVEYFETVLSQFGSHYMIYQKLANAYEKMGETEKARAALQQAIMLYPNSADLYDQWGTFCFKEGNIVEAREKFQTALAFDQDFCSALRNFADMNMLLNDMNKASGSLERYYENRHCSPSGKAEALAKLIICYYKQRNDEGFDSAFSRYYRTDPSIVDQMSLAKLAVDLNAPFLALSILKNSIDRQPDNIEPYIFSGVILANNGLYKEAIDIWKRALEKDPKNPQLQKDLAQAQQLLLSQ